MRIDFLFSGVFWGILLILLGFSAILKTFNVNLPFFRIIFALFLIYLGVSVLIGGPVFKTDNNSVIFNEQNIKVAEIDDNEYNVIFGSSNLDLRDLQVEEDIYLEVNAIFGTAKIRLDPEQAVRIKVSSVFGSASLPNGNHISFGDRTYSKNENSDQPVINIEASAVFGKLDVNQ